MINLIKDGDIFKSGAQCLVNAVNCDGIMGGGIALEFKLKFPSYYKEYRRMCAARSLRPGRVAMQHSGVANPQYIASFPTKDRVVYPSRLDYVIDGMPALRLAIIDAGIQSIAIPALGCGLGGLSWDDVKPIIMKELADVDCVIRIYEPLS